MTAALTAPSQECVASVSAVDETTQMDIVFATDESPGSISDQVRRLYKLDDSERGTKMVLLDIPDDDAYYVWTSKDPDTVINESDVRDFIADYKGKTILHHQLG